MAGLPPPDGGPAFPSEIMTNGTGSNIMIDGHVIPPGGLATFLGMSQRAYFAAKALPGVQAEYLAAAREAKSNLTKSDYEDIVADAFTLADLMLRECR